MVVILRKYRLAYFPVRKVATTTIVDALRLISDIDGDYRATYNDPMSARQRRLARGCHKFAVVRDPIARILSSYGNRIVHHKDLSSTAFDRSLLRLFGRSTAPDIDEFCQNIRAYWLLNDKIRRHIRLQTDYLGRDLGYFDAIYEISDLDRLAADLSERTGKSVTFSRLQTAGPKIRFSDLAPKSKSALLLYTRRDYDLLKRYFRPPQAKSPPI